jgi:hypothetical protein
VDNVGKQAVARAAKIDAQEFRNGRIAGAGNGALEAYRFYHSRTPLSKHMAAASVIQPSLSRGLGLTAGLLHDDRYSKYLVFKVFAGFGLTSRCWMPPA